MSSIWNEKALSKHVRSKQFKKKKIKKYLSSLRPELELLWKEVVWSPVITVTEVRTPILDSQVHYFMKACVLNQTQILAGNAGKSWL